jgi:hypothetical protein
MPSRKQRRRRAKERRHEYEYVYVDDTGQEIEPPPEDKPERDRSRDRGNANGGKATKAKAKTGRPLRQARPPSWNRSIRRALLFLPLFFIVFSLVNKNSAIEVRFLSSLAYSALFVPLTYMMDRTAYRTYLRRSGQQPGAKR